MASVVDGKIDPKLSFNPEWMKSSSEGQASLLFRSSTTISQDTGPLAPVKLAKNRYGREEMLVLLPQDLPDIDELRVKFPDFHSAEPLLPICMANYSDDEERIFMQGVNSSKAIAAVNHVEKQHNTRWSTATRGGNSGGPPVRQVEEREMFTHSRSTHDRGDNFREIRRPYGGGPLRGGSVGGGGGGRQYDTESWRNNNTRPTENPRAQGLFDQNDPRDRPRRFRTVNSPQKDAENEDEDFNAQRVRLKYNNQSGSGSAEFGSKSDGILPEWAMEDMSGEESGSFDNSGEFKSSKNERISTEKEFKGKAEYTGASTALTAVIKAELGNDKEPDKEQKSQDAVAQKSNRGERNELRVQPSVVSQTQTAPVGSQNESASGDNAEQKAAQRVLRIAYEGGEIRTAVAKHALSDQNNGAVDMDIAAQDRTASMLNVLGLNVSATDKQNLQAELTKAADKLAQPSERQPLLPESRLQQGKPQPLAQADVIAGVFMQQQPRQQQPQQQQQQQALQAFSNLQRQAARSHVDLESSAFRPVSGYTSHSSAPSHPSGPSAASLLSASVNLPLSGTDKALQNAFVVSSGPSLASPSKQQNFSVPSSGVLSSSEAAWRSHFAHLPPAVASVLIAAAAEHASSNTQQQAAAFQQQQQQRSAFGGPPASAAELPSAFASARSNMEKPHTLSLAKQHPQSAQVLGPAGLHPNQQNVNAYNDLKRSLLPSSNELPAVGVSQLQQHPAKLPHEFVAVSVAQSSMFTNVSDKLSTQAIDDTFEKFRKDAESLVNSFSDEDMLQRPSLGGGFIEDDTWLYLDPHGTVQGEGLIYTQIAGPFEGKKMAAWFRMGYFTMTLLVKRKSEDQFLPLADLIKNYGRVPFDDGPSAYTPTVIGVSPSIPVASPTMAGFAGSVESSNGSNVFYKSLHGGLQLQQPTKPLPSLSAAGTPALPGQQQTSFLDLSSAQIHRQVSEPAAVASSAVSLDSVTSLNASTSLIFPAKDSVQSKIWGSDPFTQDGGASSQQSVVVGSQRLRQQQQPMSLAQSDAAAIASASVIRQIQDQRQHEHVAAELMATQQTNNQLTQPSESSKITEEVGENNGGQWQKVEDKKKLEKREDQQRRVEQLSRKADARNTELQSPKESCDPKSTSKSGQVSFPTSHLATVTSGDKRATSSPKEVAAPKHVWGASSQSPALSLFEVQQEQNNENCQRSQVNTSSALQQRPIQSAVPPSKDSSGILNNAKWSNSEPQVAARSAVKQPQQQSLVGTVQSLLEIQLEEQRQVESERRQQTQLLETRKATVKTACPSASPAVWGSASSKLTWSNSKSAGPWECNAADFSSTQSTVGARKADASARGGGFWDDSADVATKQPRPAAQQQQQQKKSKSHGQSSAQADHAKKSDVKQAAGVSRLFKSTNNPSGDEFLEWCVQQIHELNAGIDAEVLAGFLKNVESPDEVENYVTQYCGNDRAVETFVKSFLLKRSQHREKEKQRAKNDELLMPVAALNPQKERERLSATENSDFSLHGKGAMTESSKVSATNAAKSNNAKKKKSKMSKITDGLGFQTAPDSSRLNAGEIDTTS